MFYFLMKPLYNAKFSGHFNIILTARFNILIHLTDHHVVATTTTYGYGNDRKVLS